MINRKKIELEVLSLTNSHVQAGAYALILQEKQGSRQVPVIIGATEAQAIIIELRGVVPPRPLTHTLFASVLEALGVQLLRVLIYRVENGIFYSYLFIRSEETIYRVDARTSDAVVLSMRMAAPIYIYEDIMNTVSIRMSDMENNESGPDYNPVTEDENIKPSLISLQHALEKAVEKENYEQAALLRDKIKQLSQTE